MGKIEGEARFRGGVEGEWRRGGVETGLRGNRGNVKRSVFVLYISLSLSVSDYDKIHTKLVMPRDNQASVNGSYNLQ